MMSYYRIKMTCLCKTFSYKNISYYNVAYIIATFNYIFIYMETQPQDVKLKIN